MGTGRRGRAQPIRINGVGAREMQRDRLHHTEVVLPVQRRQRHRVGPVLYRARRHAECIRDVGLVAEAHHAQRRAIQHHADAVRLVIGGALQRDVQSRGNRRVRVQIIDRERLVHRLGTDHRAEEVVVVDAVQQRRNIGGALFQRYRCGIARYVCGSLAGRPRRNSLTCLRSVNQPVDARAGERRIDAGAVERDRIVRAKSAGLVTGNQDGLLRAFGVELQPPCIADFKTRRSELRSGHGVPAFGLNRNFGRRLFVQKCAGNFRRGRNVHQGERYPHAGPHGGTARNQAVDLTEQRGRHNRR